MSIQNLAGSDEGCSSIKNRLRLTYLIHEPIECLGCISAAPVAVLLPAQHEGTSSLHWCHLVGGNLQIIGSLSAFRNECLYQQLLQYMAKRTVTPMMSASCSVTAGNDRLKGVALHATALMANGVKCRTSGASLLAGAQKRMHVMAARGHHRSMDARKISSWSDSKRAIYIVDLPLRMAASPSGMISTAAKGQEQDISAIIGPYPKMQMQPIIALLDVRDYFSMR